MLQNNLVPGGSSLVTLIDEYLKIVDALKFHVEEQIELGFLESPQTRHPALVTSHFSCMEDIKSAVENCQSCPLHETRIKAVFGAGNEKARLVFVGEAPGADEDQQGQPFVGRAGQKLTQIVEAIGLSRSEVYITNVLKCRPPKNRDPLPDEVHACEPYLIEQLRFIKPRVICALGAFAAQTLLRTDRRISSLRGRFHTYQGIKLMPTYHPAYLLRNPKFKRDVWEDVKKIRTEYDRE